MSEDDVKVSKEDIENVERELLQKDKAREDTLRAKIEAEIKQKMADEAAKKAKEEEYAKLLAEKEKLEAMVLEQAKQKEEEITKLRSEIGSSKAIINNANNNPTIVKQEGLGEITEEMKREIDESSLRAFLENKGLTMAQWKPKR